MESRLGGSGLKVPGLTLGTGTFGGSGEFFNAFGDVDVAGAKRLVDIAMDAGAVMFDSADVYSNGRAEEILGAALKGRRDRALIIGARNEEQLVQNLGAVGWSLSQEHVARLEAASAVPRTYPYRHQAQFSERNPFPTPTGS